MTAITIPIIITIGKIEITGTIGITGTETATATKAILKTENVLRALVLISFKNRIHFSLHFFEKTQLSERGHHFIIRLPALIPAVAIKAEGRVPSCDTIGVLSVGFALIGLSVNDARVSDFLFAG